tara:strand:- start:422 stop:976 length:555 start_codon:yes stop_codon:yes gene_type:complete
MKIFKKYSKPTSRKRYSRAKKEDIDSRSKDNLKKLHPMSYSLLSIKASEDRPNEWVKSTFDVINNKPHVLSEKWIGSINSWTESAIESMMLDEPDIEEGSRACLGPFKLLKIIPPKDGAEYPTSAMLLVDERGWKWYLKSSKSNKFKVGDDILLTATISSHKDGITFLKRASKIRVANVDIGIF